MADSPGRHIRAALLVAHGSREPATRGELEQLVAHCRALLPATTVAASYLEFESPSPLVAIDELIQAGAREIVLLPVMLFPAGHVRRDLPALAREAARRNPQAQFLVAGPLGLEPELLQLAVGRAEEARRRMDPRPDRQHLELLVVGRGSSHDEANHQLAQVGALICRSAGYAGARHAFVSLAAPSLEQTLEEGAAMGSHDVIVLPYFLFTGVLLHRVANVVAAFVPHYAPRRLALAAHLGPHPLVAQALRRHYRTACAACMP
jgi:sirohydrochlorin ferrochelatase